MDEDYDFKVDYQMKDAAANGGDDESDEAAADGKDDGDEDKENDQMTTWNNVAPSSMCVECQKWACGGLQN